MKDSCVKAMATTIAAIVQMALISFEDLAQVVTCRSVIDVCEQHSCCLYATVMKTKNLKSKIL